MVGRLKFGIYILDPVEFPVSCNVAPTFFNVRYFIEARLTPLTIRLLLVKDTVLEVSKIALLLLLAIEDPLLAIFKLRTTAVILLAAPVYCIALYLYVEVGKGLV
jgi:hypothetical protein